MDGGYLQAFLFLANRPEPIRQSALLMVLATGMGEANSLMAGLTALAAESNRPWSDRVNHLRLLLEQGQSLSEALTSAKGLLPEPTLVAIRVGEETGTLRQVLAEEAHRLMNAPHNSSPVRASLPTTVSWVFAIGIVAAGIVSFIMMFIIPKFKKIFVDFGTELPAMTESLIGVSDFALQYWYLIFLSVITFIGLPCWHLERGQVQHLMTGHIRFTEHIPRYWTPLILRLLSASVVAGQSLQDGVHAILKELRPGHAATKLSAVRVKMMAGDDCWQGMVDHSFLKPREKAFLDSATRNGHLDWGLLHLSKSIEQSRNNWGQRIAGLIQPMAILVMGFVVMFICISLFLPLVKLINDLS